MDCYSYILLGGVFCCISLQMISNLVRMKLDIVVEVYKESVLFMELKYSVQEMQDYGTNSL